MTPRRRVLGWLGAVVAGVCLWAVLVLVTASIVVAVTS